MNKTAYSNHQDSQTLKKHSNSLIDQTTLDSTHNSPTHTLPKRNSNLQHLPHLSDSQSFPEQQESDCEKIQGYLEQMNGFICQMLSNFTNGSNIIKGGSELRLFLKKILPKNKIELLNGQNTNILQSEQSVYKLEGCIKDYIQNYMSEKIDLQGADFNLRDIKGFLFYLISRQYLSVVVNKFDDNNSLLEGSIYKIRKNSINNLDLREELINTMKKYQALITNINLSVNQRKVILETRENIKHQIMELENPLIHKSKPQKIDPFKNYIQIIFEHYVKLQHKDNNSQFNESIKQHKPHGMNIGKFILFCKDFDILIKFKLHELHQLFKRYSHNQHSTNFHDFYHILQVISTIIFHHSEFPILDLYAFMDIDSPLKFKRKLKNLRILSSDSYKIPIHQNKNIQLASKKKYPNIIPKIVKNQFNRNNSDNHHNNHSNQSYQNMKNVIHLTPISQPHNSLSIHLNNLHQISPGKVHNTEEYNGLKHNIGHKIELNNKQQILKLNNIVNEARNYLNQDLHHSHNHNNHHYHHHKNSDHENIEPEGKQLKIVEKLIELKKQTIKFK